MKKSGLNPAAENRDLKNCFKIVFQFDFYVRFFEKSSKIF